MLVANRQPLVLGVTHRSCVRLARFQRHQLGVLAVAPVQMFAVALMVVDEGRHLGDGGGRVGRGAHGAVLFPPLTPLGLVLHPLPLQSRLNLDHKDNRRMFLKVWDVLEVLKRSGTSSRPTTVWCETNTEHSCQLAFLTLLVVRYVLTLTSMTQSGKNVLQCNMDLTKLN